MTLVNEHGQPVGEPVAWSPRAEPAPAHPVGHHVAVEPVAEVRADDLFAALCGPGDAPLWTHRGDEPPADAARMHERVVVWSGTGPAGGRQRPRLSHLVAARRPRS